MYTHLLPLVFVIAASALDSVTKPDAEPPAPGSAAIYHDNQRTQEVRPSPPDRYDLYDRYGNRTGYGQRNTINGDIDLFDTHGNRLPTVIRPKR